MKALIIYDLTGKIWNIIYGETEIPQGVPCLKVDIPEGAQLERVDLSDPEHPQPVFRYLPETDIEKIKKRSQKLEDELANIQLALVEQYEENLVTREEITNLQLALVELYEGKEV